MQIQPEQTKKQFEVPVQASQFEFHSNNLGKQAVETWMANMPNCDHSHNTLVIPVAHQADAFLPKKFESGETYQQIGDVSQLTLPDKQQISVVSPRDGAVPYLQIIDPDGQWSKSDLGWKASAKDQGFMTVGLPDCDVLKTWSNGSGELVVPTSKGKEMIEFDRSGISSFGVAGHEHVLRNVEDGTTE
jgi:hypothetical protein